jgi:hypothetical protein
LAILKTSVIDLVLKILKKIEKVNKEKIKVNNLKLTMIFLNLKLVTTIAENTKNIAGVREPNIKSRHIPKAKTNKDIEKFVL